MNNKWIIAAISICISQIVYAQPGKENTVVVQGDYTPKIVAAEKIFEQPTNNDSSKTDFDIKYDLLSKRVNTVYEIDPIKAANVKGEPLNKLYKGYVKGGFGTYMTPYAELFYHNLRSKKHATGVHLKHLSSGGQISEVGYSGFSQNQLSLFGKSFIKKSTLSGGLDYRRNVIHYYGFNTNPIDTSLWSNEYGLERNDIKQRYQLVNIDAALSDNYPVDSHATKYKVDMNYYNYTDKFNAQENRFRVGGDVSFYYQDYNLNAIASVDYYKNQNDSETTNLTIVNLRPKITFKKTKWRLQAGLNAYISNDPDKSFRFAPEVDFDLHIYENIIILNVGTDSRFRRNSYRNLTEENPFLFNDINLRNTWSPFRWYAGLRGAVSSRMSFNVKASYVLLENQYFFVNDTSKGNWNKMNVVYDDASLFQVNGEITYQQNEKLRFIAKVDFMGFTPSKELKAWHVPSLRMSYGAKYNLRDKIWINAAVLTFNRQFARNFFTDPTTGITTTLARQIGGITDINLGAEYRYTKKLGMFVQLNNILNVRYQRYQDFPTQRFNVLAGLSFSF